MYCKNCHTLMPDGEIICNTCGYDNSNNGDILEETKEINLTPGIIKKNTNKKQIRNIILLVIIALVIGGATYYIINDSKSIEESKQEQKEVNEEVLDKEFIFDNFKLTYPSSLFGASKSTIFYKNNNAYNIEIKDISLDEFNNYINDNFKDDSKLGTTSTFTYAEENKYYHIFEAMDNYYMITVNYLVDGSLESTKAQLELTRIINSLIISE